MVFEAICGDCVFFIGGSLSYIEEKFGKIVNIELVPFELPSLNEVTEKVSIK